MVAKKDQAKASRARPPASAKGYRMHAGMRKTEHCVSSDTFFIPPHCDVQQAQPQPQTAARGKHLWKAAMPLAAPRSSFSFAQIVAAFCFTCSSHAPAAQAGLACLSTNWHST